MGGLPAAKWQYCMTGLFSIAFAYHVACGDNIVQVRLDPNQLRSHLFSCFKKQELSRFPLESERVALCMQVKDV